MKVQILIPFLIYLVMLVLISFYASRSASGGMTGFFLGGRKIKGFTAAISSVVSARGSWLILGVTTQAYIIGLSAIWLVTGYIVSEFLMMLFLAPAIQKYSQENNCLSVTDIIVSHHRDERNFLRIILSVVILAFLFCFVLSQIIGGSQAFYAFFGLTAANGIIITGVIVLAFTFFGGIKSIGLSDIFHAVILLAVLVGIPVMVFIRKEGFHNISSEIQLASPGFFSLKALSVGSLLGFLSVGLGSLGNPHILVKYMSVDSKNSFPFMAVLSLVTNLFLSVGAICIGIFARVYFPSVDAIPGADSQNVFIGLAGAILTPTFLGLVLISIFAMVISAAGSQILVSASTLVGDLYEKTLNSGKKIAEKKLVFYSRISIVIFVYLVILAGIWIETDFYSFVLFAWAGLGASIGPSLILSFAWKGATGGGIRVGVLTGAITVIIWKILPGMSEKLYELIPGLILASLAIWIGSELDKKFIARKFNRKASYEEIKKEIWRE